MTIVDQVVPRWDPDINPAKVPPTVVNRVHAIVGEALTQLHTTDEELARPRLSPEDERALSYKLIADELQRLAAEALASGHSPLSEDQEGELAAAVIDRLHGLGRLQPLLDDPDIRDIHIPGNGPTWLRMRDGRKVQGPAVADSDDELVDLIATAARHIGRNERRWDNAHPELNLRLPNGDRLHGLMAVTGRPTVTIRRHDFGIHRVAQLVEGGVMSRGIGAFCTAAVRARLNTVVAGGTGTGKTTTLRCFINEICAEERLITIEDSLEIGLEHFAALHPDYETIEARDANTEGVGLYSPADSVRAALRMNPERVIVGEVRGEEVLPMLLAMSQGNDGSMCSIHADSSKGVFSRLAMYAAMTRERLDPSVTNQMVAEAVQLIVHLAWVGGARRVTSVREITGVADSGQVASNEIWRPGPDGRAEPAVPPRHDTLDRLCAEGFDPALLQDTGGWVR